MGKYDHGMIIYKPSTIPTSSRAQQILNTKLYPRTKPHILSKNRGVTKLQLNGISLYCTVQPGYVHHSQFCRTCYQQL